MVKCWWICSYFSCFIHVYINTCLLLLLLAFIPLDTLGQRHTAPAEAVQGAPDGQVDLAAAELLHEVEIGQRPAPTRVRHRDAAPLGQLLDELLVDATLQTLVVGGVDEELGAVGLEFFDGFFWRVC